MRSRYILKNSIFSIFSQILMILLGFVSTRVLNLVLGEALLGVNGVIANVLGILSVSDLGFTTALSYHLYKSLYEKDDERTAALMALFRKVYRIIALIIFTAGMAILPFAHLIMKENPFPLTYVRILYFLWLMKSVLSYLLGYRRVLLAADQKEYIVSIGNMFAYVLNYSSIIVIVSLFGNYLLALSIGIMGEALTNIFINIYANKHYPYLKEKLSVPSSAFTKVFSDVKNIFVSKICRHILNSTDNLIISGIISVRMTGLFNNYILIYNSVTGIIIALSNSIQPSMGNLFAEGNKTYDKDALEKMQFMFFLVAAFVSSSLCALLEPFIGGIWLNTRYVLGAPFAACMAAYAAILILSLPISVCMGTSGLFKKDKTISVVMAVTNIAISIGLISPLGVSGVVIGTIISLLFQMGMRIYYFFRDFLGMGVGGFLGNIFLYFLLTVIETALTFLCVRAVYYRLPFHVCYAFLSRTG